MFPYYLLSWYIILYMLVNIYIHNPLKCENNSATTINTNINRSTVRIMAIFLQAPLIHSMECCAIFTFYVGVCKFRNN